MSSSTFMTEFLRSGTTEADLERIFAEYDPGIFPILSIDAEATLEDRAALSDVVDDEVQSEAA
jgi:hypothetical protein